MWPSCFVTPTERAFALVSSTMCMLIVLLFFIASWMFGIDSGGPFVKACLQPNDIYDWRTFETFGKIWVFGGIVIAINILGIILCACVYIWLKLEEREATLITTKVYKFLAFQHMGNHA